MQAACRRMHLPSDVDVVFTTPSHQCPTATTMPLDRRRALLQRASEQDFLIVEDDYEFEMSFLKAPSPALKSSGPRRPSDLCGQLFQIVISRAAAWLFGWLKAFHTRGTRAPLDSSASSTRPYSTHRRLFLVTGPLRCLDPADGQRLSRAAPGYGRSLPSIWPHGRGPRRLWWQLVLDARSRGLIPKWWQNRLRAKGVLIEPGRPFFTTEDAPKNYYRLAYSSLPVRKITDGVALIASEMHP